MNRRFRRLPETRILNMARLLADLVDQLGAADHDAVAFCDTGHDEDPGSVERLYANRTGLEMLRLDVTPDQSFAIATTHDRVAANDHAAHRFAELGTDRDRLSDTDRGRRVGDRELHHGGLLLQRRAPPLKAELHGTVTGNGRGGVLELCR